MRNVLGGSRATKRAVAALAATAVALPLTLATAASATAAPGDALAAAPVAAAAETEPFDVLVFSKTAGFRHGSIPAGIAAIQQLGADNGFSVTATEDAGAFTDDNLAQYEAVVWLSTTGDVLNDDQQAAFERYVQNGGGYAGVHAASDTEYDWPWYGELVGAYFNSHPQNQDATIKVEDQVHESTAHLPARWDRYDEWYNFRTNPRDTVHVLASLDESSYDAGSGAMGADHPTAWCQSTTAVAPGTPAAGTRTSRSPSRSSCSTCWAASRRRPASSTPTAPRRRRRATSRSPSTPTPRTR
ncbi:ThuA domain-containing protein [Cellulosimicrobium sp. CUA-896]|uniref:ThuA domain-containing protein n=1 Tax=Cellulosimicrobium sp. CUA-896 TaxID=1517881 RepID=UPI000AAC940E|nr:ThuA domain-containing protein [Cellulosimicrobium sp. CUA-896]